MPWKAKRRRLLRVATAIVLVVALPGWTAVCCRCGHDDAQAAHDHTAHDHGHGAHGAGSEPADGQSRFDCGCHCTAAALVQMGPTKPNRWESFSEPSAGMTVATNRRDSECAPLPLVQHAIGPPGCNSGVPTFLAVLHLLC